MTIREIKSFIKKNATESDIYNIIIAAANKLGWNIAIEEGEEIIRGLTLGTDAYMKTHFSDGRE